MDKLKEKLVDWTDIDIAEYILAVSLGLMSDGIFATKAKHIFWTNNKIEILLLNILQQLVEIKILVRREEPDIQFRWNSNFKGSWE